MHRMLFLNVCLFVMSVGITSAQQIKDTSKTVNLSPIIMKMRVSYKYIFEGVAKDVVAYERYLKRAEGKAKIAKTQTSRDRYNDIVTLLKEMIAVHRTIEGMFNGTARGMEFENAMRMVPMIEKRLPESIKGDVERGWLTADEVRKRLKVGGNIENALRESYRIQKKSGTNPRKAEKVR